MPKEYPQPVSVGQCCLCFKELYEPERESMWLSNSSRTCFDQLLMCKDCERQFKRKSISKPPKRPVR